MMQILRKTAFMIVKVKLQENLSVSHCFSLYDFRFGLVISLSTILLLKIVIFFTILEMRGFIGNFLLSGLHNIKLLPRTFPSRQLHVQS